MCSSWDLVSDILTNVFEQVSCVNWRWELCVDLILFDFVPDSEETSRLDRLPALCSLILNGPLLLQHLVLLKLYGLMLY